MIVITDLAGPPHVLLQCVVMGSWTPFMGEDSSSILDEESDRLVGCSRQ